MNDVKIGDKLEIHCYKHNGHLHRQWDEAVVLDIKEDYIVFGNNRTTVVDSDGKVWRTKEPAIMFFFKDRWFNIIGQLKDYGIYFYCNIATPFLIDERVIKYIDYDLDFKVDSEYQIKTLDEYEYKKHKKLLNYSDELDEVINYNFSKVRKLIENKEFPFSHDNVDELYKKYLNKEK